jgi:DNA-binding transcriptional ArsR family regulator
LVNYQDCELSRVFAALGDPTRRAILARLEQEECVSVSAIAKPLAIKLPALMKHLGVLRDAGLITRRKRGRTVEISLSAAPLHEASGWLHRYESPCSTSLFPLHADAEGKGAEADQSEGPGR